MAGDPPPTPDPPPPEPSNSMSARAYALSMRVLIGVIAFFALIGAYLLLSDFSKVTDVTYARGLITILFSVGVVAMALIIILTVLLQRSETPDEEKKEEKQFQRSKEILSLLLGILGTVVGYYFGTSDTPSPEPPAIISLETSTPNPAPGATATFTVLLRHGKPPLDYAIELTGVEKKLTGVVRQSWIKGEVAIPNDAMNGTAVKAKVTIKDSLGREATKEGMVLFTIKAE